MKQPKRLTREDKILLTGLGYDPEQYLRAGADKQFIRFVPKGAGETLTIER